MHKCISFYANQFRLRIFRKLSTMPLLPAWMKGLTPEMVKVAETELGETPEKKVKALEELKMLIKDEESKGFYPLQDEEFLIRFLRARKYDVDRAFTTLKNYYKFKSEYSEVMMDLTPSDLKRAMEMECIFVSPKRNRASEGILIVFVGNIDFNECSIEEIFALGIIGTEVGLETEASQVCGGNFIISMQDMSFRQFKHFIKPSFLRCLARYLQDVVPGRVKGIHLIHEPSYFDIGYSALKPFLSKKMTDRIHFHGDNLKSLHEFIPPEALPKKLDGHLGQKDLQDFRTMMLQNTPLIERINTYTYNGVPSKQALKAQKSSNTSTRKLFKLLDV